MPTRSRILPTLFLALAGSCALARAADDSTILREGEGARRSALNRRERTPFPAEAWAKLADWQNGTALTKTTTDGRPVLIVTWTDYLPTAKRAVATATALAEKHKDLVVVLVHGQQEWATAKKPKAKDGATLLVAHDANGEFRRAIDVDQDPDFYLIDRAGQLRFADVRGESVEPAVDMLIAESATDAGGVNARLQAEAAKRDVESRRLGAINASANLTKIPDVPFDEPSEEDYEKAKWPKRPKTQQNADGEEKPRSPVTLPETDWHPTRPELKGKAVLAYIWHPSAFITFEKHMAEMDQFQKQQGRDLVVVGLLTNIESFMGRQLTKDETDPEKLRKKFEEFCRSRNFNHYIVFSVDNNIWTEASGEQSAQGLPWPCYVIIGSDGKAAYWSPVRPEDRVVDFQAALLQVLQNDPGVKARRAAEQAWLKANKPAGGP